jgi:hypothetical protein
MAYSPNNLSVLAYANGFTLWHYTTTDTAATTDTTGYFNGAADMLRVGDMILANVETTGAPGGCRHLSCEQQRRGSGRRRQPHSGWRNRYRLAVLNSWRLHPTPRA